MKKFLFASVLSVSFFSLPMPSFAQGWIQEDDKWMYYESNETLKTGWFNDIANSAWYYFDDTGIMVTSSWVESNGKKYYLSENGKMLSNAVTPDGVYVDESGAAVDVSYNSYDNIREDSLSFIKDGETITVPCKIYYNNERVGRYTTLCYETAGMEAFNGTSPNLIITYTATRTGGYNSTYIELNVYVNGDKRSSIGGSDGDIRAYFNKNYMVIPIQYSTLNKGDFVEIYING